MFIHDTSHVVIYANVVSRRFSNACTLSVSFHDSNASLSGYARLEWTPKANWKNIINEKKPRIINSLEESKGRHEICSGLCFLGCSPVLEHQSQSGNGWFLFIGAGAKLDIDMLDATFVESRL